MKAFYLSIVTLVMMGSCVTQPDRQKLETELLEADKAFSEWSVNDGMNSAFMAYGASDAVLLRENSMPVEGLNAIRDAMEAVPDTGFVISWEPLYAKVANSGDLGYTYGLYSVRPEELDTVLRGTYVTVWTRVEGEWKWALDSGNEGLGR